VPHAPDGNQQEAMGGRFTFRLKIGIFGAEPWTEAMRAEIEEAFGITALDIYGLSEVMGPGVRNRPKPHKGPASSCRGNLIHGSPAALLRRVSSRAWSSYSCAMPLSIRRVRSSVRPLARSRQCSA